MWLRFVPAGLWAFLIFFLSSQSRLPRIPGAFPGVDKLAHAAVFGVFAFLLLYADRFPRGWRGLFWVGIAFLYGVSDEIHQSFVPGRTVDIYDGLADLTGALLAFAFVHVALPRPFARADGA